MKYDFDKVLPRRDMGSTKWLMAGGEDVLALSTADMDFETASCVKRAVTEVAERGIYAYTIKPESYYDSVIGWYRRRHGVEVKREWLMNVPGVWTAARMCFQTYAKPGDRILVHAPHFFPIIDGILEAGCVPVTEPLILREGRYEVDLERFEETVARERPKIFFLVNPQNPTGRSFTREELTSMVSICRKYGTITVSDEVHANIVFDGHAFLPIVGLDQELMDSAILITSASKGYNINGLQYCYLVIPDKALRARFESAAVGFNFTFAVNTFSVAATEAALSEEADDWLRQCNDYILENLDFLTDFIETRVPRIKVIRPESGYLVWLDCRGLDMTPDQMHELFLDQAKVALTWGETYGSEGVGFERINIGCPRSILECALLRIEKAALDARRI